MSYKPLSNHWSLESLHWLRDVVYREDDSTAHTRSSPRVMAAMRNHERTTEAEDIRLGDWYVQRRCPTSRPTCPGSA